MPKDKKEGFTIFDVGANNGQSIRRFKKLFPNSKIFAFEPQPDEIKALLASYRDDNTVKIVPCAIGGHSCSLDLNVMQKSGT